MTDTTQLRHSTRFAGVIGWYATLGVAVILAVHPFGTTTLYSDGEAFLDHVGTSWVLIHIAATLLLFVWAPVIWEWARTLATPESRFVGRAAAFSAVAGVSVGAIHMLVTDTTTFVMFRDTYEAGGGSEATGVAIDLLLRFHASTLVAWVTSFWFLLPALLAWACRRGGKPTWLTALAAFSAACQVVSLALTFTDRQWTTLSETVVFRTGATVLLIWFLATTWEMRRTSIRPGSAAAFTEA